MKIDLARLAIRGAALSSAVALCGFMSPSAPLNATSSSLSPMAWSPDPVAPQFNVAPKPLHLLRTLDVDGPESCTKRGDGVLACGAKNGRIVLIDRGVSRVIGVLANTGGRPLGMTFDGAGRLLVADSRRGLLAISPNGEVKVLRARAPEGDLVFPDDVTVRDQRVWLTNASKRRDSSHVPEEFLEQRPSGSLYALDEQGRGARVLDGLAFANGVAASPDGTYVLVNETERSRLRTY